MIYYIKNKEIKATFNEFNDAKFFILKLKEEFGSTVSEYRTAPGLRSLKASGSIYSICEEHLLDEFLNEKV